MTPIAKPIVFSSRVLVSAVTGRGTTLVSFRVESYHVMWVNGCDVIIINNIYICYKESRKYFQAIGIRTYEFS